MECGAENLGLYITLLSILFILANHLEYLDVFFLNCSNAPNPPKQVYICDDDGKLFLWNG